MAYQVTSSSVLVAALSLLSGSTSVFAGEQANQAMKAIKALQANGTIPAGTTLTIVSKPGMLNNMWGKDHVLKERWEKETGIKLDGRTTPNKPIFEYMKSTQDFDITLARHNEYPDLFVNNLIVDLSGFIKKYDFKLEEPGVAYIDPEKQMKFDDKYVAIPSDGDIAVLFVRLDLLNDPKHKLAFENKFKMPLRAPQTWEEYEKQLEYFHAPDKDFYGCVEHRDPQTGWMFWMPRFASQANPNKFLFDDKMNPQINTPEGIRATKSYLATVKYSAPLQLKEDNHYSYAMSVFTEGKAYAYIASLAAAKQFNRESVMTRGKFASLLIPGTMHNGKLVRRSAFIYGNNLVVAKSSKHQELAFLYSMWLTDPELSEIGMQHSSGMADPYRLNHIKSASLAGIYTQQALNVLIDNYEIAVPEGTGLPGDAEYISSLSKNLYAAAKGLQTAEEAMKKTEADWNEITKKMGRENQFKYLQQFKKKYPSKVF